MTEINLKVTEINCIPGTDKSQSESKLVQSIINLGDTFGLVLLQHQVVLLQHQSGVAATPWFLCSYVFWGDLSCSSMF